MASALEHGSNEDQDGSKTSRELAALRAAVAELTVMVNELARRQPGKGTG